MQLKGADGGVATVELTSQEATRLAHACTLAADQFGDPMTGELVMNYGAILHLVSMLSRRSPVRIYDAKPKPTAAPAPAAPPAEGAAVATALAGAPEEVRPALARHLDWLAHLEPALLTQWMDTVTDLEPEHLAMVVSALARRKQSTSAH